MPGYDPWTFKNLDGKNVHMFFGSSNIVWVDPDTPDSNGTGGLPDPVQTIDEAYTVLTNRNITTEPNYIMLSPTTHVISGDLTNDFVPDVIITGPSIGSVPGEPGDGVNGGPDASSGNGMIVGGATIDYDGNQMITDGVGKRTTFRDVNIISTNVNPTSAINGGTLSFDSVRNPGGRIVLDSSSFGEVKDSSVDEVFTEGRFIASGGVIRCIDANNNAIVDTNGLSLGELDSDDSDINIRNVKNLVIADINNTVVGHKTSLSGVEAGVITDTGDNISSYHFETIQDVNLNGGGSTKEAVIKANVVDRVLGNNTGGRTCTTVEKITTSHSVPNKVIFSGIIPTSATVTPGNTGVLTIKNSVIEGSVDAGVGAGEVSILSTDVKPSATINENTSTGSISGNFEISGLQKRRDKRGEHLIDKVVSTSDSVVAPVREFGSNGENIVKLEVNTTQGLKGDLYLDQNNIIPEGTRKVELEIESKNTSTTNSQVEISHKVISNGLGVSGGTTIHTITSDAIAGTYLKQKIQLEASAAVLNNADSITFEITRVNGDGSGDLSIVEKSLKFFN